MSSSTALRTPPWLLALGKQDPPAEIEVDGRAYRLGHTFKHDFFAFTGRYDPVPQGGEGMEAPERATTEPPASSLRGQPGSLVLKVGRRASLFFVPLSWIGRLHSWHESAVFRAVEDLEVVPRFTGRYGKHGLTHEYIEGHQLERGETLPPDFFDRLECGLREMHERGMAYVDLEKPENVLVGEDGSPWLFDFQISYLWPWRWGKGFFVARWLVARLQESDHYHLTKLRRRCSPETMSPEEIQASRRRPTHLRLYNSVTRPLTRLRRRILNRIDPVKKRGERGRVQHGSRTR